MRASAEISYYPLKEEYITPIQDFIDRLNKYDSVKVITTTMSTRVIGEYFEMMEILTKEIHNSFEVPGSVFVMKVINADLDPDKQ